MPSFHCKAKVQTTKCIVVNVLLGKEWSFINFWFLSQKNSSISVHESFVLIRQLHTSTPPSHTKVNSTPPLTMWGWTRLMKTTWNKWSSGKTTWNDLKQAVDIVVCIKFNFKFELFHIILFASLLPLLFYFKTQYETKSFFHLPFSIFYNSTWLSLLSLWPSPEIVQIASKDYSFHLTSTFLPIHSQIHM